MAGVCSTFVVSARAPLMLLQLGKEIIKKGSLNLLAK